VLNSSFDITILGTDLPALIFGALAAKKNYRVLVIGQGGHDNIYDNVGHFQFVSRVQLIYGLHSSVFVSDCFSDLAMGPEIRNRPKPLDPIVQVVMPGVRLDLPVSAAVLEREMKREFPAVASDMFQLIEQELQAVNKAFESELADFPILPSGSIKDNLSRRGLESRLQELFAPFSAKFSGLGKDPNAIAALNAMASGLALTPVQPGGIAHSRLLWHLRNGLVQIDWGLDGIRDIFIRKIEQNAGEVRRNESVDSISTNWKGAINKLKLSNSGDEIGTSLLVIGMDQSVLPDLIMGKKAEKLRDDFNQSQPTHYLFTMNLGMHISQVPDAMANVIFNVSDPKKTLDGDNFLIIQKDSAMEPVQGNTERAVISVSAFMPAELFDGTIDSMKDFGVSVLDALRRDIMPFLDVENIVPSIAGIRQTDDKGHHFIDSRGFLPIYPDDNEKGLGLFTLPIHTRYKNMLNLGAEVTGNLGFEGAFYTAREALKITQALIKLRGVT